MTLDRNRINILTAEAADLLKEMIAIPSESFSEDMVCTSICNWMSSKGLVYTRIGNNIIARISEQDGISTKTFEGKPTLMLCAHIDTVKANENYSFDPYCPDYAKAAEVINAKIDAGELAEAQGAKVKPEEIVAGLGSNDDGASVVSMIAAFRYFGDRFFADAQNDREGDLNDKEGVQNDKEGDLNDREGDLNDREGDLQPMMSLKHMQKDDKVDALNDNGGDLQPMMSLKHMQKNDNGGALNDNGGIPNDICNLMLVLSCEEERSGIDGMTGLWPQIKDKVDFAIIGEPTGMKAATSERGLLVIDATAYGVSGHAARNEGINAIDIAINDIAAIRAHQFAKTSPRMGKVNLNVTQINAGTAHNVIPDTCTFVIDIRPTEQYTNEEILHELQRLCESELKPRNLKNRSSATQEDSPLQKTVESLGIKTFSSPTTSDWMRIDCDAIKMGPGNSDRSHKKDEFVFVKEIKDGISTYIKFIESFRQ